MSYNSGNSAREFAVETNFQRMACRPGGIPRAQALRNAKKEVLRLFIRCSRPVRDKLVRAMRLPRSPRVGWFSLASGVKFD